jgi:hypothetical protein
MIIILDVDRLMFFETRRFVNGVFPLSGNGVGLFIQLDLLNRAGIDSWDPREETKDYGQCRK